jgi:hypothetical protein
MDIQYAAGNPPPLITIDIDHAARTDMRLRVVPMRLRGVAIAKAKLLYESGIKGDLRVEEVHDPLLKRTVRVARLVEPDAVLKPDLLPPLLDVQLLWMSSDGFTVAGFERIAVGVTPIDYAQSWWVRPA